MDTERFTGDGPSTGDGGAVVGEADLDSAQPELVAAGDKGGAADPLSVGAVVTGILLLSPVAIVLGHLALKRAKSRPDQPRTLAIAGTILGYLGLAVTIGAIAAYMTTFGPGLDRATADAQAQADVTAIGNAVATALESDPVLPDIAVGDESYTVGGDEISALLAGEREVELSGTSRTDWCVQLGYEGGEIATVAYVGADGFHEGACD
ncbi:DUF4190 domain-containing protein [Demequina salsinemoris]|uniref:DUF4190 domain-containing protein n=1 Tax=Demequina salsinemoris TaxID=577470 RepID=UPI0007859AD1|nr:DUF4190 domain-containing protein [Demequina salsinemoris]